MNCNERLVAAAKEFCEHEIGLRAQRAKARHCEFRSEGDASIGDYGTPSCTQDVTEEPCESCKAFWAAMEPFRYSLRKRRLAKERMVRAYSRMGACE